MAKKNVNKATAVGITAGVTVTPLIAWLSGLIEVKAGMPSPVTASVLGGAFAFVARWAAKLDPHI